MRSVLLDSLAAWWPETILSLGALTVITLGAFPATRRWVLPAAWLALAASAVALWHAPVPPPTATFFGLIICDPFSLAFRWLAWGTTALVMLLVTGSREVESLLRGEYVGLLLFVAVG